MYDECNIRYPDDAPEAEHGNHGHRGFPRPSQDARDTVGESEQEIKEGDGPRSEEHTSELQSLSC